MITQTFISVAKEYVTYPMRFEKPLYEAAQTYCTVEDMPLSQYIRKLVKKDLQERGKWPLKG